MSPLLPQKQREGQLRTLESPVQNKNAGLLAQKAKKPFSFLPLVSFSLSLRLCLCRWVRMFLFAIEWRTPSLGEQSWGSADAQGPHCTIWCVGAHAEPQPPDTQAPMRDGRQQQLLEGRESGLLRITPREMEKQGGPRSTLHCPIRLHL